jgi:hypothetical protein
LRHTVLVTISRRANGAILQALAAKHEATYRELSSLAGHTVAVRDISERSFAPEEVEHDRLARQGGGAHMVHSEIARSNRAD